MVCNHRTLAALAALVALAVGLDSPAADSSGSLAKRLAAMRSEVEKLSSELTDQKTDTSNELRALARQKADLQVELEREKVRIAKLRSALTKRQEAIAERSTESDDLAPIFDAAVTLLTRHVEGGLPFRSDDRLAALAKIKEQRVTGVLSTERALARLWGFVEDEFRMTRESGLFRQSVRVGGEDRLAEVVRVGMVMLFYRTDEDAMGHSVRTADGWSFAAVDDKDSRRKIDTLFDNFKKQIRVGFFRLPNALPASKRP